jgi:hypothetical protein
MPYTQYRWRGSTAASQRDERLVAVLRAIEDQREASSDSLVIRQPLRDRISCTGKKAGGTAAIVYHRPMEYSRAANEAIIG